MTILTVPARPFCPPALETEVVCSPDPQGHQMADRSLGTLESQPQPSGLRIREGLYFIPAWDPEEEARASCTFTGVPLEDARHESRMRVAQAARRRALHGVTWRYERLTVRVRNACGELLATESLSGISSDLPKTRRQALETGLLAQAMEVAQDWAILGLN